MNILRGNTIIEVLIAATLVSIAILAALSLSSSSQKQTDFSRNIYQASTHNSTLIDWLRNLRTQTGWANFAAKIAQDGGGGTVRYCLNTPPTNFAEFVAIAPAADCGSDTIDGNFQREIEISLTSLSGNPPYTQANIVITTYWADRTHQTSTETKLTAW